VGSFETYGKALNMQQLLQNRGCHVTTRRALHTVGVDVYAMWPGETPVPEQVKVSPQAQVVWQSPPAKRAGMRQAWEVEQ
jgi:hypothetical protein